MSSNFEQHCGQCGELLPAGSTQCPRCGAPVSAPPTGAGGPPSEFFPSFQEQIDSADTLIRPLTGGDAGAQSSPLAAPAEGAPASGELSISGNTGPTGPLQAVPAAPETVQLEQGAPATAPLPPVGPEAPAGPPMGAPQFSGALPGGPTWPGGAPQGAPSYAGQSWYPGQPSYPGQPGMPGYGVPPGAYAPGYGAPGTPAAPTKAKLPAWFTGGIAALVAVGLLLIWLTGSDWADGSFRVGIAALVVAALALGGFLFWVWQGHRATRTISLGVASVLVLIVIGAAGIALVNPLHKAQGSSLDSSQQYAAAIKEYQAAGDDTGVARTYNDWGEYYMGKKNYQTALDKFTVVLNHYKQVPDEHDRAYADAATANYALGQEQETGGQCTDAVATYQNLVKNFANTLEASKAKAALKKPQDVTGQVLNTQTRQPAANVQLFLSADWQISNGSFSASDDYTTVSDSSGKFTFSNIPPSDKKYLISYVDASGNQITRGNASGDSPYAVLVAPLCAPGPVTIST